MSEKTRAAILAREDAKAPKKPAPKPRQKPAPEPEAE